jgi:adenine-specific DNA-methyltransferase
MATLDFKGKALVQNYHLSVKYHELMPKRDRSLTDKVRLDDNLIIHGDNLKALKALLPTYAGKVKCIYVDPPYNTGNEGWAYNDNVNSPMMLEWLGKAVDREDLTRHDKWLCMITPRLKLLKELLHEEGVILVSIDDNEDSHLRVLMDEIFGEENFVAQLVWEKGRKNDAKLFSVGHEYIVVYARSRETLRVKNIIWREEKSGAREIQEEYLRLRKLHGANNVKIQSAVREYYKSLPKTHPAKKHSRYGNVDDRGIWRDDNMSWPGGGGPAYDVIHPRTKKPCAVPEGGWRYSSPERLQDMIKAGVVVFREDETEPPIRKTYLIRSNSPFSDDSVPDEDGDDIGIQVAGSYFYRSALQASNLLVQLFGKKIFENPKDHEVLKRLIRYVTQNEKEAIILDSFAGSGTTAHAVLALNKEDGGNRKFILVECEDYADSITAERVRRVIKGVKGASDEHLKKGLGGTFSYFELGKAIELDSILDGKNLPSYLELARYVFYTATGEEFDERKVNEKRSFVGESKTHEVYLFYQPDMDYLKKTALTLERAESLGKMKDKRRLVFAPTKYLDQEQLDALRIDFAQLPFEIYKLAQ